MDCFRPVLNFSRYFNSQQQYFELNEQYYCLKYQLRILCLNFKALHFFYCSILRDELFYTINSISYN